MRKTLILSSLLFSNYIWANLYIRTEFLQATEKKPIITKHHIFLNQPYEFRYWNRRYILTLKKIEKSRFVIETETYNIKPLKYEQISGSIGELNLGGVYTLEERDKDKKLIYRLNIFAEKIAETSK